MATAKCSLGHGLHLTAVRRSTRPCIPSGSLNRVPASSWEGGIVTSAGWQVTPCDPMWHVSSRSGEAVLLPKRKPRFAFRTYLLVTLSLNDKLAQIQIESSNWRGVSLRGQCKTYMSFCTAPWLASGRHGKTNRKQTGLISATHVQKTRVTVIF